MSFVIFALLVGCGGEDGGTPGDASAHVFCVDETNRYRAMRSKPAVTRSEALEDYANDGAMIDFSGTPHDHFRNTGGGGIAFAENECPRWSLAQQGGGDMKMLVAACIAAFYSEGPGGGHFENMMGNYGTLGCGIYESEGRVTIIQDFGR